MRIIYFILIFYFVIILSCNKDKEYYAGKANIISVDNNYKLRNNERIKIYVSGKNTKDFDRNEFYIDHAKISATEVLNETAYEILIPENTFSDTKMSGHLSFHNGKDSSQIELFADGFPHVESISKKVTYPGEFLDIEGKNLSYSSTSEVLFLSESGLTKAKVLQGGNFLIRVEVPEDAISGLIVYKIFVKKESLPRAIQCGSIEIRK